VRSHVRFSLLALLAGAMVFVAVPAAQAAFGVERFFASNCNETGEECGKVANPTLTEAKEQGFTQAGGHPNFGITDFTVKTSAGKPEGVVTHIRTDVAPGLSTNPEAVPKCSFEEFGKEALPKSGLFEEPKCPAESKIGINKVKVYVEGLGALALEGPVYNLVQPTGLASDFGVSTALPKFISEAKLFEIFKGTQPGIEKKQYYVHTLIEGSVEWASDYHDYFEINVSPTLPLISSRLTFFGNIGKGVAPTGSGGFITNPTSCTGTGPQTTSKLTLTSKEGATAEEKYTTLLGTENCGLLPFAPTFALTPETTQSNLPDGITTELVLPHDLEPGTTHLDSSQLKTASVTLPEGMTLNESAARGLEACTPAQIGIHTRNPVSCPAGSKIGTLSLNVPGLPSGSLPGKIFLGGPETGPITGPPYIIYLDAESPRYGISVRLKGEVFPSEATGRLTTIFSENPEQPFSNLTLNFNGGALAPLANPLTCGSAKSVTALTPFAVPSVLSEPFSEFLVDSNNAKGSCASPLPFSLTQSTENQSSNAGANTSFSFHLTRPDGNQYLSKVKATLPPGLVGMIPAVAQCGEPQASLGTCTSASRIGTATVEAGAGPAPFVFSGPAYLTGPFNGAPFGLSIAVPAVAGPFNLGTVVTRGTINIDPFTAQVSVEATLPRIVKGAGMPSSGVMLRLRKISMAVNKQGFLLNPTNCGAFATESTLTGFVLATGGATGTLNLASPFQVGNCGALGFKPSFKATTGAKTSKANGASLETTITQGAGQANIKSVLVQLPRQLPSRLTTLQKACPAATFAANPYTCPSGSFVGSARAKTPLLPGQLNGPAILVSHAAAAFPDLDLVLEGSGVRTIVVGNTDIKRSVTTTNFAATPDVPVSSFTVNLPTGPHSALTAIGNVCATSLVMPTTITAQNGKQVKQKTKIEATGCPVRIVGHKVIGNTAYLTIQTYAAGRISGSGRHLQTVFRSLNKAVHATTLKVPLARGTRRPLQTRIRVGFRPKKRGTAPTSSAFVTVRFR
jgi:hypothetical protein